MTQGTPTGDPSMCKCPEKPEYQPGGPFEYQARTGPYCNMCKDLPWVTTIAHPTHDKWWIKVF